MPPLHSHTQALTPDQAAALRSIMTEEGYEFETKPYTLFAGRKGKLTIAVYEKGPKAVIQGKGIEDFIRFTLEPHVLGEARFDYEEELSPELYSPHFGIDESGKGDFFGPLVIAGVHVDRGLALAFRAAGIRDSKAIASDRKIRDLAEIVRRSGAAQSVVAIGPAKYNDLFRKIGNLNRLLAWGHARVIENLCAARPECHRALSDQFANAKVLQRSLLEAGRSIVLEQRTKAESDYAVAAASILAREKFIGWLDREGGRIGIPLPRGASAAVKSAAREIIARFGQSELEQLAKMHFKTAGEILIEAPQKPAGP